MSQSFELLGVPGLLLPGTVERPCPWDLEGWDDYVQMALQKLEEANCPVSLAKMAATAACWWRMEMALSLDARNTTVAINQRNKWQLVFERACERMVKT